MSSDTASVDFARRVAHFDIQESDKSDDDDDSGGAGGVSSAAMGRGARGARANKARADDIEKEYLMGGGGERGSGWGGADDEDAAMNASEGACTCNNRCGGNEKSSRIEGRNILLTVTILSMATAGFLLYSSFAEWNATNRRTICIIGIAIGAVAELCGIVGLIGLCRFSDTDKIPFKAGYWLNLIQLWANAGYFVFLLFLWDGKYDSGTMALAGPAASAAAAAAPGVEGAAAAVKAAAAFIELSVVAGAASTVGLAAAPAQGPTLSAKMLAQFNAVVGTQIWFLGLSAGLILFSLLYAYGSLRLRCKKMGKWGTTITAVLLAMLAMATLAFAVLAIRYNTGLRDLNHLLPLGGQMAVAGLILATVIYELYVSTQVQKLKLAAKSNFTTLLIMTLVATVLIGVSHYTYYLSLKAVPRIDLLSLTALAGIASQVLLLGFGVQMMAWRQALPDEYPSLPAVEKFGGPAGDDTEVFIPPTEY